MWGDPEGALRLESSDSLAALIFQVTGPAHVPWQDPRWQEFLHGYDIWIHAEPRDVNGVIDQACKNLAPNAPRSSNLAAFSMHVTRMLLELASTNRGRNTNADDHQDGTSASAVDEFSNRIATVGRARATSGSLNLLRILVHAVIVHSRSPELQEQQDPDSYLQECFLYRSRDSVHEQDTGSELLAALIQFAVSNPPLTETVPELYDATVLSLQLTLVLLSSQLYQPMVSSFQRREEGHDNSEQSCGFFWDTLLEQAQTNLQEHQSSDSTAFTPRSLLRALMDWTYRRPAAPERSVAHHNAQLAQSVVSAKGERMGADGMYESHMVVSASAPPMNEVGELADRSDHPDSRIGSTKASRRNSNILIDATKGVLILSSSIILLPFRLMQLALGLWGNKERGYDQAHRKMLQTSLQQSNLTKDVLWLSDSAVGDLASCLLLLILNNERAGDNPFRDEVMSLVDNRWETDGHGLPDLPDLPTANGNRTAGEEEFTPLMALSAPQSAEPTRNDTLALNFESLFELFGRTTHTEVGALLLYTLMQSSQAFAESLAVRSDLDTLVLPILRTLYISSSVRHYAAQDFVSRASRRPSNGSLSSSSTSGGIVSIRNCPFRSQSQLYVIIILLLLFSQDASFGPDAFRRNMVANVQWYKERNLKDVNLGSVLLLCLLRSLTFNLNRLHDAFLLSNCCAILMNLSPAISDLHEYAAMRLVSITISSMKRYIVLQKDSPDAEEEDLSTPTAMHGEVCRTLLRVLKQCLSAKNVERNLNLVYALVYHQTDFKKIIGQRASPFKKGQTDRVLKVTDEASKIIEQGGDARTAAKALKVLSENMDQIREVISDRKKRSEGDGFTFTYEEEADPEIFFVPYVWEVIVCVATSSSIEWNKSRILVFPLLDDPVNEQEHNGAPPIEQADFSSSNAAHEYSEDVSDVV